MPIAQIRNSGSDGVSQCGSICCPSWPDHGVFADLRDKFQRYPVPACCRIRCPISSSSPLQFVPVFPYPQYIVINALEFSSMLRVGKCRIRSGFPPAPRHTAFKRCGRSGHAQPDCRGSPAADRSHKITVGSGKATIAPVVPKPGKRHMPATDEHALPKKGSRK